MRSRTGLTALLICLTPPAMSAAASTPSPSYRSQAAAQPAAPGLGDSMARALESFRGERVLIPLIHLDVSTDAEVAPASKLLGRLQRFCEAFTPVAQGAQPDMIPFGVRGTWVIAPEMQVAVNFDYRSVDPRSARSRATALRDAVLALPPDTLPLVGSTEGAPIGSLPDEARDSLLAALRPPLTVHMQMIAQPGMVGYSPDDTLVFDSPLDPATVRLRVRLRSGGATLRSDTRGSYTGSGLGTGARAQRRPGVNTEEDRGSFNLTAIRRIPNKFKATDLDGTPYTQPLGIHGVQTVAAILERVERVTGLRVHPSAARAHTFVFIGSDAVTCGEALDGLRLAFTGAWRKVGSLYTLCWDRDGLRAVQRRWNEAAAPVLDAVRSASALRHTDERWIPLLMRTPFATDDPMRWTDSQREAQFGELPVTPAKPFPHHAGVPFAAMTPDQQDAVRAMTVQDPGQAGLAARPLAAEECSRVFLSDDVHFEIEVRLPRAGWVLLPEPPEFGIYARVSSLESLRTSLRIDAENAAQARKPKPSGLPPELSGYGLGDPPAKEKAVLVRALPPAALPALVKALKARGVTALVYPVLANGYASMPGTPFPLDPALKGANGWAAAVKAAGAAGLKVYGAIDVLAWRVPSAAPHWLDGRPDLLDIDDTGRTRSQWFATLGEKALDTHLALALNADLVRAGDPEVASRLSAVVAAAAATPGAAGLLFDRWELSPSVGVYESPTPPSLGFAVPDRVAAILAEGCDPLDRLDASTSFRVDSDGVPMDAPPRSGAEFRVFVQSVGYGPGSSIPRPAPTAKERADTLLASLVAQARKAAPAWKTLVVTEGTSPSPFVYRGPAGTPTPRPGADTTLYTQPSVGLGSGINSLLLRVASRAAVREDPSIPSTWRDWQPAGIALARAFPGGMARQRAPGFGMLVYDFRAASDDDIATSLAWLTSATESTEKAFQEFYAKMRSKSPAGPAGPVK